MRGYTIKDHFLPIKKFFNTLVLSFQNVVAFIVSECEIVIS